MFDWIGRAKFTSYIFKEQDLIRLTVHEYFILKKNITTNNIYNKVYYTQHIQPNYHTVWLTFSNLIGSCGFEISFPISTHLKE